MSVGGAILELLFPTKCAFCHRLTEGREQRVCPRCIKSLPYARGAAAEQKLPHIVKCVSPFYYEGDIRQSLLRYKFGGVRAYCDIYAEFLVKTIDERAVSCDIITWVPLNAKRLRSAGTIRLGSSPKRRQSLWALSACSCSQKRATSAHSP